MFFQIEKIMREFGVILLLMTVEASKEKGYKRVKGVIGRKKMSLPAEMLSEIMIESNNTDLTFNDMLNAYQYPIDYKRKYHSIEQRNGFTFCSDHELASPRLHN